jgi:small-conductance mechanosensitive channel
MNATELMNWLKESWHIIRYPLLEVGGNKITLFSVLTAVFFFYASVALSKVAERLIGKILKEKTHLDHGVQDSIMRFTRYTVLIVGVLITLDTIGISIKSLAALGAVLMVGIGFGLQNITQNFISGLIILLERPIKIGDLVEVKGVRGKVVEIGARSTLIHTRDDIAIIVPNSQFISEQVINESFSGEKIRLGVNIGVSYGCDPKEVEASLLMVAKDHVKVLKGPVPSVVFQGFGSSSLDFSLMVWVSDLWNHEKITSDLRFAIVEDFRGKGIEIPFTQMDLHIKNPEQINPREGLS